MIGNRAGAPNLQTVPLIRTQSGMLSGAQIRAARSFLRWSAKDLAAHSGVGIATIHRAEAVDDIPPINARTLAAIEAALEEAGVVGIDRDASGGEGVRRKRS